MVATSASPALAAGDDARVRFVHAVPGVGKATLSVADQEVGSAGFGEAGDPADVPAGPAELALAAPGGVKLSSERDLAAGASYTVVALGTDDGAELRVFANREAKPGMARLRMIHAAPELGDGDFTVGDEVIARGAGYTDETGYLQLEPGSYELSVRSPDSGEAVVTDTVPLAAGTSDTALVLGSQGEQTRLLVVEDDVAAPAGAPETGLGGLARARGDGADWTLAIAAALAAGILGLAASLLVRPPRRSRRLPED